MRVTSLAIAALLSATIIPAQAQAPTAPPIPRDPAAVLAAGGFTTIALSLRAGPAARSSRLVPVQYGPCYQPGMTECVNGWVAVCQCFSYGCQFMATAYHC